MLMRYAASRFKRETLCFARLWKCTQCNWHRGRCRTKHLEKKKQKKRTPKKMAFKCTLCESGQTKL